MSTISASTTSTTAYKVTADTTGTLVFQTGATPTTALTIGSDQSVTFAGAVSLSGNQTTTGNLTVNGNTTLGDASTDTILMTGAPSIGGAGYGMGMGFRNRIINGAMQVNQRGGTISATGTVNTYGVDRFAMRTTAGSAVVSMEQSTVAPAGFYNSLLCTVTTADASLAASDLTVLHQKIEGVNTADLGWGTANAQTVTISFQVRSNLTGTYGVGIQNNDGNRSYPSTYTINTANTWETKTLTIPGDTSGTWNTGTTSTSIYLWFGLAAGSTYTGTANAWAAADYRGTTGQVNWGATLSNTFYITGVQLEKGSTATTFDYRPYGTELALCQRYYETSYDPGTAVGAAPSAISYPRWATNGTANAVEKWFRVTKRATPTVTVYDTSGTVGKIRIFDGITDPANITPTAIVGLFNSMYVTYNATANGIQFNYVAQSEL